MNYLRIGRQQFGQIFWDSIFSESFGAIPFFQDNLTNAHTRLEANREFAEYNTGSVSIAASITLACVSYYFRPEVIAEVGTFIGRSAFSLGLGCSADGRKVAEIYTCDYSNEIFLNDKGFMSNVKQFKLTPSHTMFTKMAKMGRVPDLYFIDGELSKEDLNPLRSLRAQKSVILLDDCVANEKGMRNLLFLLREFDNSFLVAAPPSSDFLRKYGVIGYTSIAALLPVSKVRFVVKG